MEQRSQHERRHYPRFRCEGKAEIRVESSRGVLWGTVTDLSAGGCYIELAQPLPLDYVAHVTLTFYGVSVATEAKVVAVHPMFGMGMLFTACPPEEREKLKGILAELSGSGSQGVSAGSDGIVPAPMQPSVPAAAPVPAAVAPSSAPAPPPPIAAAAHRGNTAGNTGSAVLRIPTQAAHSILDQVIKHLSQKGTLTRAEMLAILKQNQSR